MPRTHGIDRQFSTFLVVGVLGNSLGWIIYALTYGYIPISEYKPTFSWIISFHFGVVFQHHLHRRFTFDGASESYSSSLYKTYISYLGVLFLCIFANFLFNEKLEIYHHISWLLTVFVSLPISFISLKFFAFGKDNDKRISRK